MICRLLDRPASSQLHRFQNISLQSDSCHTGECSVIGCLLLPKNLSQSDYCCTGYALWLVVCCFRNIYQPIRLLPQGLCFVIGCLLLPKIFSQSDCCCAGYALWLVVCCFRNISADQTVASGALLCDWLSAATEKFQPIRLLSQEFASTVQ